MRSLRTKSKSLRGWLIGAYLFSVPAFSYSREMGLNHLPQLLGLFVVIAAFADYLRFKRLRIPFGIQLYALFLFWLIITFSLGGLINDGTGSFAALLTSVKVGLVTLGVTQLVRTDRDFFNALSVYATSMLLVYYLNYESIHYLQHAIKITGMDRFDGTMSNANTAAMYSLSIIWASFVLLLRKETKTYLRLSYVIYIVFGLNIIYFCGSKKGLVGVVLFAIMLSWIFFQKYKKSLFKRGAVLVAGACLLILSLYFVSISPFYYRFALMTQNMGTGSTGERIYLFFAALDIWLANPINFIFGVGHDSFRALNKLGVYSHSTVSEVFVSTGIVGFVLYFSVFIVLGRDLYSSSKLPANTPYVTTVLSCILFVVLVLFFNTAAVMYSSRDVWPLLGIIGAYCLSLKNKHLTVSMSK